MFIIPADLLFLNDQTTLFQKDKLNIIYYMCSCTAKQKSHENIAEDLLK